MLTSHATPEDVSSSPAAAELADFGFVVHADLPDRPGSARLLVALRERPTLRHFDPELVEYWVTEDGRGRPHALTRDSHAPLPLTTEFSWGVIRIVDRLAVTNEYLTFGGELRADLVDGVLVCVFTSPAPLLRRGGHSQGWDHGAQSVGAFFGRLLIAVDCLPAFEATLAAADPLARYSAFVADSVNRYRASPELREAHPALFALLQAEAITRLAERATWSAGLDLLTALSANRISAAVDREE